MKKKVLLDLHVLDLIIENKSVNADRIRNYSHDLLIYGQQDLYTIFYIENDLVLCKNQDQIREVLIENKAEKLEYTQLEVGNPIYSSLLEISKYASRFEVNITDDIILLNEIKPFKRDRYSTIEMISLLIIYDIEYFLTLNPYIKLDFLYLKSAINRMSQLNNLKIRIH